MVEFNWAIQSNGEENVVFTLVFIVSTTFLTPIILFGNALVIIPFLTSHRVRTPSNYLILYLAIVDISLGLIMPLPCFIHQNKDKEWRGQKLIRAFEATQLGISIASFSFMVSIALDKAFSLAKPLRYSSVVTRLNIQLYSIVLVLLSATISASLTFLVPSESNKDFQIMLLGILLIPCVILTSVAYFYIYTVASRHIQTIRQLEVSVRSKERRDRLILKRSHNTNYYQSQRVEPNTFSRIKNRKRQSHCFKARISPTSRYGVNLSLTIALLLGSRLPGPLGTLLLEHVTHRYLLRLLDIPLYICSAFNPWIYAYHNLELKKVMRRLLQRLKKVFGPCKSTHSPPVSLTSSKTSKKPGGKCLLTTVILEGSFVSQTHTSNHPTVGCSEVPPSGTDMKPSPHFPTNENNGILCNIASLYAIDPSKNLELSV